MVGKLLIQKRSQYGLVLRLLLLCHNCADLFQAFIVQIEAFLIIIELSHNFLWEECRIKTNRKARPYQQCFCIKTLPTMEQTTAIPRDTLPLDMLTPQIRHYELRQKISRYANFSDLSTPSYAIFQFFQKNSRYANFSDLSTPSYAIFDQSKNSRLVLIDRISL